MLCFREPRVKMVVVSCAAGLSLMLTVLGGVPAGTSLRAEEKSRRIPPLIVAHRGLLRHAPENTLANFRACLELGLGFEVDVRRSRDGHLVCVHDDTVDRTTNGRGAVASHTLAELHKLDAGSWFSPVFQQERIPTLEEVLTLIRNQPPSPYLVAIDLKAQEIETDCVRLAKSLGVLDRLLFIGNAIDNADVRRKLRQADASAHVACLVGPGAGSLAAALADPHADWVYFREIPTLDEMLRVHKTGKKAFIAGKRVVGQESENWRQARLAGIDAILTDYPLELAHDLREAHKSHAGRHDPKPSSAPGTGTSQTSQQEHTVDQQFERLAARFIQEFPALSPIGATALGDHRFDQELDEPSEASRRKQREFCLRYQADLARIPLGDLSRENQVDYQLLAHHLRSELWSLDRLQEWAWNPVIYTQQAGGAIYGLMAREFAPVEQRLMSVAARLEKFPQFYQQVRSTLDPRRVPLVHAETASKQNRGVLSILDNMVRPQLAQLSQQDRERLVRAMTKATAEVEQHQQWLDKELIPQARGDHRLGARLFEEKLALTLGTPLTRQEIRERAELELQRVRQEMYTLARKLQLADRPAHEVPENPSPEIQQQVIATALERAHRDIPARDGVVPAARKSLQLATDFVRRQNLVTIPADPIDIIEMPEFQRGVSVAYCDSPGPLEVGQKTFYAVAPLPKDWTDQQCTSFLREYNFRSIHNLTVHEAMPGHFLQLAHANRHPHRLRSVLGSGVFIEGWACYTEQMMSEEGFLDRDPLMRLTTLKWYLRVISNSILDQAVHIDGIRREDAMRLMMHDTFQEEREAAGKWVRAQLTSTQLSTYFVGYQEHRDLRAAAKQKWGDKFTLKRYHDAVISFGSPPPRFVRALLLEEPIPR